MIPWRPLLVVAGVSAGATSAIAALCALMGWTTRSPAWAALAPLAMWTPALGRFVALRTVDRGFTRTLPLRLAGVSRVYVILWPLAAPLFVYGVSYGVAWLGLGNLHQERDEGKVKRVFAQMLQAGKGLLEVLWADPGRPPGR